MIEISCSNCGRAYPEEGAPYRCAVCGGIFDFKSPLKLWGAGKDKNMPGVWRYLHSSGLPVGDKSFSLGEGGTNLAWRTIEGRDVAFKLENSNPTGSFYDRGSAVLCSFLHSRDVDCAVVDSCGNAGISFAAYATEAGIKARVMLPNATPQVIRDRIERFSGETVRIMGPRSNSAQAAVRAAEQGTSYASFAHSPFVLSGYATISFELYEQLGESPASIILPAGHGNLLYGLGLGFQALQSAGEIDRLPQLIGVQALACAPLWAVYQYGAAGLGWVTEGETVARGVRIKHPVRGDAVLRMVRKTQGAFFAVDEAEIEPSRDEISALGFKVELTSALVWPALVQMKDRIKEPIVVILTGAELEL